jgi:outer membrane receptor protein involved in Fe transport
MDNIITYKEGSSFIDLNEPELASEFTWENNVTSGKGKSYGVELLLHRKIGKLTGWIGYTLSWTKLQFDSVNFGREYFARYDRRHDISIVAIYNPNPRITLSATWIYGTGNAITLPNSGYTAYEHNPDNGFNYDYYSGHEVKSFGEKNSFRMEPYHRFDIGIQFHKKKKKYERTWEISVYNAYNRKNPFYYYIEETGVEGTGEIQKKLKKVTLFPIIPSITYSIKF